MTEETNSRNADKFVVRLKPGMRDQLKARAKADNTTMNAAAVTAIEKNLANGKAFDAVLQILDRELGANWTGFVHIKREHLSALLGSSNLPSGHPAISAAGVALAVPE